MPATRTKQLRLFSLLLMLAMAVAALPSLGSPPVAHAATTNLLKWDRAVTTNPNLNDPTVNFIVEGIDPKHPNANPVRLPDFQFLIVEDNVGNNTQSRDLCAKATNPDYPAGCDWTSIKTQSGYAPIVTQGSAADFDANGVFAGGIGFPNGLPAGNYMISVTAAGYKIDGAWFTMPLQEGEQVVVQMNTYDLPTATLRAVVFNDNRSTNGQPDLPAEMGITGTPGAPGEAGDQPGLAGLRLTVNDTLGEITNDVFGNPICSTYPTLNSDGSPNTDEPGPQQLNGCLYSSDGTAPDLGDPANSPLLAGQVAIPNMGPNRYTMLATPPDGQTWIQTATLEGNHDWDVWVQEGSTGYDTEFAVAGEPFPWVPFGFVQPTANPQNGIAPAATGGIKGSVMAVTVYTPGVGGIPYSGSIWAGLSGAKEDKPIENPWVAISDLNNGDQTVWVGQGDAQGNFYVPHVPDGTYQISWWDTDQLYLLDWQQVDVKNGQITDVGQLHLTAWYAHLSGRVCSDTNYDGYCQDTEPGLSGFPLAVKRRTNSVIDRGNQGAVTDATGNYVMDSVYPLTAWIVIEAYSDTYYTTGATYWADNSPLSNPNDPTSYVKSHIDGAGVDVNFLTIIGQNGHLDWAVQRYNALPFAKYVPGTNNTVEVPHNGGIVGTVSYDTTRNELNPRELAVENWQVGIPGLTVNLYKPVSCVGYTLQPGERCVANPTGSGSYVALADGSLKHGPLLNTTDTESWVRPTDCVARGPDGAPLDPGFFQALPLNDGAGRDCVEGPMVGTQFGTEYAAVDGNYGFTEDANGNPLLAGDYLVEVEIPNDPYSGRPIYTPTREEDINVFTGDSYTPQAAPPACAGKLHTVDVAGIDAAGNLKFLDDEVTLNPAFQGDGDDAVVNPDFAAIGGSPFEGQQKPLCDTKLVTLSNGKSIAPSFGLFTPVPLPGRWFGYIVDDLNLSSNPQDLLFGEKAGVANSPIGIYDYANRLVRTITSDPNGVFEVLLPSTTTISCPTPTGVCANLYRIVGNDPGIPGRLNPNYNPQLRTISATFEIFPGDIEPADLAPTQIGVSIQAPGSQISYPVSCRLDNNTATAQPQLFAVDKPYVHFENSANTIGDRTLTIKGQGFGTAGTLTFSRTNSNGFAEVRTPTVTSWTNNQIVVTLPASNGILPNNQMLPGQWQLSIKNGTSGMSQVNGLTIHVLQNGVYNPTLLEVGPGKPYATIQAAINRTDRNLRLPGEPGNNLVSSYPLIVVYPGGVPDSTNPTYNPQLAYFENLLISQPLSLQGVGPGGVYTDADGNAITVGGTTTVDGSIIDGGAFVGDTAMANTWRTRAAQLFAAGWLGNQTIYEGAVITAVAPRTNTYTSGHPLVVDGFTIQGGNQQGFPGNVSEIYGLPTGAPVNVETQGGGLYANSYVDYLGVTNNIFQANGGAYGGAIRISSPNLPGLANNGRTNNASILHNRIIANGGTNLAGAVGLFSGSNSYDVGYNDICGNFSAEYGGAIGHYGLSTGGKIHDNRIYFNRSYDEGGAVMIAGELPSDPAANYGTANGAKGAGNVDVYNNLIQGNLSNDDGGGLRLLMAGTYTYNVYNNMIVNNIATHEGAGVAIDDAPNVRFYNNTVMKNITTATAVTSDGTPAAAGLSTGANSDQLQAILPGGSTTFGNPLLFNNIFADNRAGAFNGSDLTGIGAANDTTPINYWDIGVMGGNGGDLLSPTNSVLDSDSTGRYNTDTSNKLVSSFNVSHTLALKSLVVDPTYDVSLLVLPWRVMPGAGTGQTLVAVDLPPNLLGNYHLAAGSPAINMGAASKSGRSAPTTDIDGDTRTGNPDAGADELVGGTGGGGGGATDPTLPSLTLRDNFNRNNSNFGLGNNWSQPNSNLRVNNQQASANSTGQAIWNGTGSNFGATQGAAFTFASTPATGTALYMKASSGSSSSPSRFIRVRYETNSGGQVVVATTINGSNNNPTYTTRGTLAGSFANGDTLSAVANADGSVDVWKTSGATTTYLGHVSIPTSGGNSWSYGTSGGRIGIYLPSGARVDNFSAQTLP
ncbi:hypothetical protein K2Z83_16305 [Oscillochloris sp. ZM17-4]|uniref:hypothetical protein n=1 Tax=Oscillochloris sp. ZM17-4 TaxID=2866714 RepID=UPI001C73AD27|nr:hypothetical protein [Oscillochloris sp. ZM17-4]MBX0329237.1 hypothetical protein [Oscillochloris sp. ZM17-4]